MQTLSKKAIKNGVCDSNLVGKVHKPKAWRSSTLLTSMLKKFVGWRLLCVGMRECGMRSCHLEHLASQCGPSCGPNHVASLR